MQKCDRRSTAAAIGKDGITFSTSHTRHDTPSTQSTQTTVRGGGRKGELLLVVADDCAVDGDERMSRRSSVEMASEAIACERSRRKKTRW